MILVTCLSIKFKYYLLHVHAHAKHLESFSLIWRYITIFIYIIIFTANKGDLDTLLCYNSPSTANNGDLLEI